MRKRLIFAALLLALVFSQTTPSGLGQSRLTLRNRRGNPAVTVWVNIPTHVYHCPRSRWYGATKRGEYMMQREAQRLGNRPAYGRLCK